jgi:hypothetical protein
VSIDFFPGVRFWRGFCVAEHGDSVFPTAARDGAGNVFLLDSPAGFEFLRRRNAPVGLDSASVVLYAATAALLAGGCTRDSADTRSSNGFVLDQREHLWIVEAAGCMVTVRRSDGGVVLMPSLTYKGGLRE